MKKRTFDEMVSYFNRKVADMEIDRKYKMELLGMITAILQEHDSTIKPEQQWIPCSERLPEEHESIWAKAKGTDRWSEAMWEKQSDEVIVTELFEDGTTRTDTACTHDGEWYVRVKMVKRKIIAWMPLPEPYEERREE